MRAVAITGFKKSGKTTLCESIGKIVRDRGIRAAAVKCTHHEVLDQPGTDTERLAAVYPSVAAIAGAQSSIFWGRKRFIPDIAPLLDADLLVVEGGKSLGWLPRVLVLRSPEEAKDLRPGLALCSFGEVRAPGLTHFTDEEKLVDYILERAFALPGLDCSTCGREDCATLAEEIVAGSASIKDCLASESGVKLTVNGVPLGMNPFSERILTGAISGILNEFKGFSPGTVEISFEHKG